ncbi:MAG: lysophospholipid acyltransferase family protein [Promethearchaeota archaeon]
MVQEKKDSWGKQLNPVFKLTAWINRTGVYKIWKILPNINIKIYGRLFGTFFLHVFQRAYLSIIPALRAIFPEKSEKRIKRLYKASIAFLGQFLLHTMFITPRIGNKFSKKHVIFKNLEIIDKALEKGKGVIIPSLHISNFIEGFLGALVVHDKRYSVAAVASQTNMNLFNEILKRPEFAIAIPIRSIEFANVKEKLLEQLKQNRIVAIMFDYTRQTQFRVPFCHGKYPYLQHTPQSVASLHRATGAPIIPAITHTNGSIAYTFIEFLDNKSIMEVSRRYKDASKKEFYGRISTEINKKLNPYLRVYAHLWEEIMNFVPYRIADWVRFEEGIKVIEFLTQIKNKMQTILEYSFEPDRKDEKLLQIINESYPDILETLKNPQEILRQRKTKINLSKMDAVSEILKLCYVSIKELKMKNEPNATDLVRKMTEKIKKVK